jgi:hypothetical protein
MLPISLAPERNPNLAPSRSSETKELDRLVAIHYHGALEDGTVSSSRSKQDEPLECAVMEMLLAANWGGRWGQPVTTDELLNIGRQAFEPLFHQPPIGPIPDYVAPHLSVHGCVAEYEDKFEELDRWKALELDRWLRTRIGKQWNIAGKTCQLLTEEDTVSASHKYRFIRIEDPIQIGKLPTNES